MPYFSKKVGEGQLSIFYGLLESDGGSTKYLKEKHENGVLPPHSTQDVYTYILDYIW